MRIFKKIYCKNAIKWVFSKIFNAKKQSRGDFSKKISTILQKKFLFEDHLNTVFALCTFPLLKAFSVKSRNFARLEKWEKLEALFSTYYTIISTIDNPQYIRLSWKLYTDPKKTRNNCMNGYTFYYPVMFANKYIKFLAPYIHDSVWGSFPTAMNEQSADS